MEWKIDYIEEDAIVNIKTSGQATWEGNRKMSEEALLLGRKNKTNRFLLDHQNLEPGLSVLQVDDLPAMLKEVGVTGKDKMAILFDPLTQAKMRDSFSFFRNSAILKSLQVRLFINPEEATAWLKSD
jgi:hypothetical protein